MSLPVPLLEQSRAARAALKRRLERLYRTFDARFLATDPLAFVHRYADPGDREIVGFLASALAFGNVRSILASVASLLAVLGGSPSRFVDRIEGAGSACALDGLYHRWIRAKDLAALLVVLQRMRERSGTIGRFFLEGYRSADADIGESLASFSARARALAPNRADQRALPLPVAAGGAMRAGENGGSVSPFFSSPSDGSACKRLNLYLRWMVRSGDGLDLGLWREVSPRQLVLPLDTHLVRLSLALGLTRRRSPGWPMALEATRSLALLDPDDPVKYDFSLSRLGILDLCLHGRDPLDCSRCGAPRVRQRRVPVRRIRRGTR